MTNEWTCHICGDSRRDSNISVRTHDKSEEYGLPSGTFSENIRYCNDNHDCIEKSKTYSHSTKEEVNKMIKDKEEKIEEMTKRAVDDYHKKKDEFDEGMKKVGIFFSYFIAISVLGSFISSISGDETFLEHFLTPWLVPVRLILAYIVFKLRVKKY